MDRPARDTEIEITPDAIANLRARDYVVVPRIPTRQMIEAAWESVTAEDAGGVWDAMVESAPSLEV